MTINFINIDNKTINYHPEIETKKSVQKQKQLPSLENLCADVKGFESSFKMDLLPLLLNCSIPHADPFQKKDSFKYSQSAASYTCLVIDRILEGKSIFFTKPTDEEIKSLKAIKTLLEPIANAKEDKKEIVPLPKVGESCLECFSKGFYRIEKVNETTSNIYVYSAASGISSTLRKSEYFDVINGPQTTGFYCFKNVPDEDVNEYRSNNYLNPLKKYFVDDKSSHFMKQQTTENGAVKSINALLFHMLGKESFKKMTVESKFSGLLAGFNNLSKEPSLKMAQTIGFATFSFQKLLYKNRGKEWINFKETGDLCEHISRETDKIKNTLVPKFFPDISPNVIAVESKNLRAYKGIEGHETISKEIESFLQSTLENQGDQKKTKKSIVDTTQSIPVAKEWKDLPNVLNAMEKSFSYIHGVLEKQISGDRNSGVDLSEIKFYMISLVQGFLKESTTLKNMGGTSLSKEEAKKCLKILANTMNDYEWSVSSTSAKHTLITKVTFLESLALAHRLALMADADDTLSKFGMFIKPYQEQIENDLCFIALDNTLLERFKGCIAYFDKINEGKKPQLCDFVTRQIPVPASNFAEIALLEAYQKEPLSKNSKFQASDKTMQPPLDRKANQFITQLNPSLNKDETHPYNDLIFIQNLRSIAFFGMKQFFTNERSWTIMNPKPCEERVYRLTYSWNSEKDYNSTKSKIDHRKNGLSEYDFSREKDIEKRHYVQVREKATESEELLTDPQFNHRPSDLLSENTVLKKDPKKWDFLYDLDLDLSNPEVQTSTILDLLTRDVSVLKNAKHRRALELALFKVINHNGKIISPLFESLKNNPSILDHLDQLTKKGMQIFTESQINSEKRDYESLTGFLFIIKLRSTLLKNVRSLNVSYDEPKEFALDALVSLLNRFEMPTPSYDFLIDLRLTRLACLQQKPYTAVSTEHIAQAASDYIFVKSLLQENVRGIHAGGTLITNDSGFSYYFLAQLPSVPLWRDCIDTHPTFMTALLKDKSIDLKTLMNAVVNKLVGETEEMSWTMKETGWICATDKNGGEWKINLLLGEFFTPQGGIGQSSISYDTDKDKKAFAKLTKELFPNPTDVVHNGGMISFKDERFGSIRCSISKQTIERCIDGQWYIYESRPRYGDLYPAFLFTEYAAWIRSEKNQTIGVIADLQTGKTAYTIRRGEFFNLKGDVLVTPEKTLWINGKNPTLCVCLKDRDQSRLLTRFDSNVRLWGTKNKDGTQIDLKSAEFPSVRDSKGEAVRFEWNSVTKRWYWTENNDFFISSHYHPFLAKFSHYLPLENELGTTKILIPKMQFQNPVDRYESDFDIDQEMKSKVDKQEPSHGFYEFTITKGQYTPDVKTLPLEQRLYLIYALLAEKNYREAAVYIDSLSLSDTIGREERGLILQILNSVEYLDDHSSNASALRLAIYSFATIIDPVGDYTSFFDKYQRPSKHSLATIYLSYLNKVNSIDDPLALSSTKELEIAEKVVASIKVENEKAQQEIAKIQQKQKSSSSYDLERQINNINAQVEKKVEIRSLIEERINLLKIAEEEKNQKPSSVHPKKVDLAEFAYDTQIKLDNISKEDLQDLAKLVVLDKETKKYCLAEGVNLETLTSSVTEALKRATDTVDKQAQEIKKLISTTTAEQALYQKAFGVPEQSINKFLHASVRQDYLKAFQKLNPSLTNTQAEHLRELCIRYMVSKTDSDQLQRVSNALKDHAIEDSKQNKNGSLIEQEWDNVCDQLQAIRPFKPLESPFSLLFEATSGMRIKEKQFNILQKIQTKYSANDLATQELQGYLFELMMAGGKTTVIISALLEILPELGFFPILLSHHSQFAFSKGTIQKLQKDRFGKDLIALDYSIKDLNNIDILKSILNKLKSARARKLPMIMKNSLLQTIELKIALDFETSLTADNQIKRIIEERNTWLKCILDAAHCEGKGLMILDESHLSLSIKTEVNVTGGEPTTIPYEEVNLIRSVFEYISEDEKIKKLARLDENEQKLLSAYDYKNTIRPYLVNKLLEKHSSLKQLTAYKDSFTRFVTDTMEETPTEEDKKFLALLDGYAQSKDDQQNAIANLTGLAAVLLSDVLLSVFANTCNREFGRSPAHMEKAIPGSIAGKAVPYLGAGSPSYATQFGEYARALCYQFMTVTVQGINPEQMTFLHEKMFEAAQAQVHLKQIAIEETAESNEFFALTGFNLKEFTVDQHLDKAINHVNKKSSTRLLAEMELSRFHITEYPLIFRLSVR